MCFGYNTLLFFIRQEHCSFEYVSVVYISIILSDHDSLTPFILSYYPKIVLYYIILYCICLRHAIQELFIARLSFLNQKYHYNISQQSSYFHTRTFLFQYIQASFLSSQSSMLTREFLTQYPYSPINKTVQTCNPMRIKHAWQIVLLNLQQRL